MDIFDQFLDSEEPWDAFKVSPPPAPVVPTIASPYGGPAVPVAPEVSPPDPVDTFLDGDAPWTDFQKKAEEPLREVSKVPIRKGFRGYRGEWEPSPVFEALPVGEELDLGMILDIPERIGQATVGIAEEVGKLVYDIPINMIGATASMFEDDNPEAEHDWKDIARKAQEERNKMRMAEAGGEEYVLPWIQRKDIREAAASAGFSGVAMGAAVTGGVVALPIPVPGSSIAAALATSGTAAYKMDKAMFTQQIIDAARQVNPDITPAEVAKIVKDTKDIRSKHALWEAIPEAAGNAAQLTGIGVLFKAALGKTLGSKIFQTMVGMYGVELGTEVITQMGQHDAEIEAGITKGEKRSFTSLEDLHESLKEVGPQTFVLVSLTGGAGAVGAKTYQVATAEVKGADDIKVEAPLPDEAPAAPPIDEIRTKFESGEFTNDDLEAIRDIWSDDPEISSGIDKILKPAEKPAPPSEKVDVALEGGEAAITAAEKRQKKLEKEFTQYEKEVAEAEKAGVEAARLDEITLSSKDRQKKIEEEFKREILVEEQDAKVDAEIAARKARAEERVEEAKGRKDEVAREAAIKEATMDLKAVTDELEKRDKAKAERLKAEKPVVPAKPPALVPEKEVEVTAKFLGFDEPPGKPPKALYNIVGGKRHGSTVTAPTLEEEGIAIPETPAAPVKERPSRVVPERPPEPKIAKALKKVPHEKGGKAKTYLGDNTEVDVEYVVVDINDLVTSHDDGLVKSPDFPKELQPRERGRKAMRLQVSEIVTKLNPERLGESTSASMGAPIVGDDLVVESGNGRAIAIRTAYGEKTGADYKAWLVESAEKFGLKKDNIDAIEKPVLVRLRKAKGDRVEFVKKANQDEVARMSPTEQAKSDAERLTSTDISLFEPSSEGNIATAANDTFIKRFMAKLGTTEAAGYTLAEGGYTKQLIDRIQAAVFYKAYQDEFLLTLQAEEADPNIKNIINALTVAAPEFIKARNADETLGNADVIEHIVGAAKIVQRTRSAGVPIPDFFNQLSMFEEIPEYTKKIALLIDTHKRSAKKQGFFFREMARGLKEKLVDQKNLGLPGFEKSAIVPGEIIDSAIRRVEEQDETRQRDLFGEPGQRGREKGKRAVPGRAAVEMAGTPESIERGFDQVREALDLFGKKKPGQGTLFAIPEPPKERRKRAAKKVKREPREAQLDIFTGKAEHAIQPGLFQDFIKKPAEADEKASGKLPGEKGAIRGVSEWITVSPTGRIFEAPNAVAENADQVASILKDIGRQAKEVLYTLTVDKKGNILELFEHSRGSKSSAHAHPIEIAGHILNLPNADKVYFVHNHPSATTAPSKQDVNMEQMVGDILSLKDIEMDAFIIGGNKWRYIAKIPGQAEEDIRPLSGKEKIVVVESVLEGKKVGKKVGNSVQMARLLASKYDNKEGVVFFDSQNRDLGLLPWPSGKTIKEAAAEILAASEHLNASAYAINLNRPVTYRNRAGFIGAFGYIFRNNLQLHEVIEEGKSWADTGALKGLVRPERHFKELQSEEILYSTAAKKKASTTTKQVIDTIIPILSTWTNFPSVRVVQTVDELPRELRGRIQEAVQKRKVEGRVEGLYDPRTDQVYLIAGNLSESRIEDVLRHEGEGHRGLRLLMGSGLDSFLDKVVAAKKDELLKIVPGLNLKDKYAARWAANEWASQQIEAGTMKPLWHGRLVYAFKQWLRKFIPSLKLSDADIKAILHDVVMNVREGKPQASIAGKRRAPQYTTGLNTETESFKNWFGDSKVVRDGKPLIVYHGTPYEFDAFEMYAQGDHFGAHFGTAQAADEAASKKGGRQHDIDIEQNEDDGTWGIWLNNEHVVDYKTKDEAKKAVKEIPAEVPLIETYLSIKNPITMPDMGTWHFQSVGLWLEENGFIAMRQYEKAFNSNNQQKALADALLKNGYDGIRYINDMEDKGSESWIALKPTQIKSIHNRGTFSKTDPSILASEKVAKWHSQMENVLRQKLQGKGAHDSYVQTIDALAKKGEFKQEELDWSGLTEWVLKEGLVKGGKITKQEILDYLAVDNVRIEEVEKGTGEALTPEDINMKARQLAEEMGDNWDDLGPNGRQGYETRAKLQGFPEETKFGEHVLPGGERYRELLLTIPEKEVGGRPAERVKEDINRLLGLPLRAPTPSITEALASFPEGPVERYQQDRKELLSLFKELDAIYDRPHILKPSYRSSHWDEPNVLAHIRFDERTGPDGEKVLHIAEIQSDWHQEGRKKGYQAPALEKHIEVKLIPPKVPEGKDPKNYPGYWESFDKRTGEMITRHGGHMSKPNAIKEALLFLKTSETRKIPDAPFKKTWPLLTIKRMVRYAAENGFNAVSWDVGEEQFRRWGSEEIAWVKHKDEGGTYWQVSATEQVGGVAGDIDIEGEARARGILKEVTGQTVRDKDSLKNILQKTLSRERTVEEINKVADRVWGRMKTEAAGTSLPRKEGMISFYDKLLPNVVNKFFNKSAWGKAKVGKVELFEEKKAGEDITIPLLKAAIKEAENADDGKAVVFLQQQIDKMEHGREYSYALFNPSEPASQYVQKVRRFKDKIVKVHGLPITPEMKTRAIHEGMPLFSVKKGLTEKERAFLEKHYPEKLKVFERAKDQIAWDKKGYDLSAEGIKGLVSRVYTNFVMQEYPVARLARQAGELEAEDIENQIRRLRGKGGIVESALASPKSLKALEDSGITEYSGITKSLKDILKPLKSKEEYQDYEQLRVAEREVAFARYRPDIKGVDEDQARLTIDVLEKKYGDRIKKLREVSGEHREFERQAILQPLVKSGWMSQDKYNNIVSRPESEYYASFLREMEDVDRQVVGGGKDPVKRIYGSEKKKIPSVEGTIANLQKTVKLVETLRLNNQIVDLRNVTEDLAEVIQEKPPNWIPVKQVLSAEVDPKLRESIDSVTKSLGATTSTLKSIGGRTLGKFKQYLGSMGMTVDDSSEILLRFATSEKTYAHELGHLIDSKFDLVGKLIMGKKDKAATARKKELRAIADTRAAEHSSPHYKKYIRKRVEQVAEFVSRYLTDKEWAKANAPEAVKALESLFSKNDSLKPLLDVRPSGQAALDHLSDVVFARSPIPPRGTITVARNGDKKYYTVPGDVAKALDYYTPEEVGTVIKIARAPARLLRAGATLSAEFMARNPVRDQFSAFVYSKYGYNPFLDFGKGLFNLLGKTDLYKEYKAAGAEQSYFVSLDRQSTSITVRNLTGYKKKGRERFATLNPIEGLRMFSEWAEKGTRVGLYGKARKKGATTLEAMAEAREGTLDFGRIGSQGRAINQIVAFWNANVQGIDKMRRAFMERPGRTTMKALLGITLPSIILWFINRDDERYKALPDWQKNFFWIIPVGDDGPIIRIPKPFELGLIFGSLPERILDYIYENDPKKLVSIAGAIRDGALPSVMPTIALPGIEHLTNYSFFRERKLESLGIQRLPEGMRFTPYTTELAKTAGKATDISPIKLENWVRNWGGTLSMEALRYMDIFLDDPEVERVKKKWYEATPGLKGFIARDPIGGASKHVEDFYKNLEEISQAEAGYKALNKHERKEAVKYFEKNRFKIKLAKEARRTAKVLSGLRKQINSIVSDTKAASAEKRKKVDALGRLISEKAQYFNKYYLSKGRSGGKGAYVSPIKTAPSAPREPLTLKEAMEAK